MRQRSFWRRGAVLLIGLAVIWLMLRWFEHNQVYHPDRASYASGKELGRPFEEAHFQATDGVRLHGWFFPAGTNAPHADTALLYCHGNAGNISGRLDLLEAMLEAELNVFAFDYRGYGRSEGRPGEEGTYLDSQAAFAWLKAKGFTKIIVFGESLGGGIAAELALREPVAGLILQSTFTSIPDIGAQIYPWLPVKLLSTIRYNTASKLPRIRVPVVIMHSRDDGLINFNHCERNFAAANEPKFLVELGGGHNDPAANRDAYVGGIRKLLEILAPRTVPTP